MEMWVVFKVMTSEAYQGQMFDRSITKSGSILSLLPPLSHMFVIQLPSAIKTAAAME